MPPFLHFQQLLHRLPHYQRLKLLLKSQPSYQKVQCTRHVHTAMEERALTVIDVDSRLARFDVVDLVEERADGVVDGDELLLLVRARMTGIVVGLVKGDFRVSVLLSALFWCEAVIVFVMGFILTGNGLGGGHGLGRCRTEFFIGVGDAVLGGQGCLGRGY